MKNKSKSSSTRYTAYISKNLIDKLDFLKKEKLVSSSLFAEVALKRYFKEHPELLDGYKDYEKDNTKNEKKPYYFYVSCELYDMLEFLKNDKGAAVGFTTEKAINEYLTINSDFIQGYHENKSNNE